MLDAVLQWRFSFFSVVVLYLRLFSFVSALPAKIASCKNVMKCDVRMYVCMYVCMYVRRTRPRAIPLAMTIKNYLHAFKYDYGAPLPRPTAAEEFRYNAHFVTRVYLTHLSFTVKAMWHAAGDVVLVTLYNSHSTKQCPPFYLP